MSEPKNQRLEQIIYARWEGKTFAALSALYSISTSRVRQIVVRFERQLFWSLYRDFQGWAEKASAELRARQLAEERAAAPIDSVIHLEDKAARYLQSIDCKTLGYLLRFLRGDWDRLQMLPDLNYHDRPWLRQEIERRIAELKQLSDYAGDLILPPPPAMEVKAAPAGHAVDPCSDEPKK